MDDTQRAEQARKQYDLLGHAGLGWTEIRVLSKHTSVFVDNVEDYVKTVLSTAALDTYVGVNPRKAKAGSGAGGSGTEKDIETVTTILFDFDPIRPPGTASTDEQHKEATNRAEEFSRTVNGVVSTSGSGAHVYLPLLPLEVSATSGLASALRAYAKTVQEKWSTDTVRVDSTFDLPRIVRCWGTHNSKSNRECYYLSGEARKRNFDTQQYGSIAVGERGTEAGPGEPGFLARFQELSVRDGRLARMMASRGLYARRVDADFAMACILLKHGFTREETAVLMRKNPMGKAHTRSENQLAHEVNRIYEQIKKEIPVTSLDTDVSAYEKDLDSRKAGISTGFPTWDSMTAGLKPGRFYVEAGRPTDGKTTRLVQMAVVIAKQGRRVLYFPTEVSKSSIYDKMVSAASNVNLRKFQYGDFTAEEKQSVVGFARELSKLPLIIAEDFSLTLEKVQKVTEQISPDVIIVDFLQYMRYEDMNSSSEMARNVAGIKKIGEDRQIPVILASQLHRKHKDDTEDSLNDLKGTGSLEELGDVVTFVRTVDATGHPVKSRLHILKNKYGEPGPIDLLFHRSTCRFEEAPKTAGTF